MIERWVTAMSSRKLTKSNVDALKSKETRYDVFDSELPGLHVRVAPSGRKTYAVKYRNLDGRQVRYSIGRHGAITVAQARKAAQAILGDVAKGKNPQAEKKAQRRERKRQSRLGTLRTFVATDGEFAKWLRAEKRSAEVTLKRIPVAFADLLDSPIDQITRWQLQRWRASRKAAGVTEATIDRDLTFLGTAYSYALHAGLVDSSPVRKPPNEARDTLRGRGSGIENQGPPRWLDHDEEQRVREALRERDQRMRDGRSSYNHWLAERGRELMPDYGGYADHLEPMCLLVLNTGVRPGRELFQLQWDAIDFRKRTLTVTSGTAKAGKTRVIPLNDEALAVLKGWRGRAKSGLVFPNGDSPLTTIKTAWDGIREAAGVDVAPYALRHTFATRLVMSGTPLPVVQKLLGHADIKMTMRYVHVADRDMAAAVARLSA